MRWSGWSSGWLAVRALRLASRCACKAWPSGEGGCCCRGVGVGFACSPPKKKGPEVQPGGLDKKDEAATYSSACGSTIGAEELNGRVRNGNGWGLLARPPHQNH